MAFDAFVKINGIEGESTDFKHQGWIGITSYKTKLKQKCHQPQATQAI